jgi:hypothetical protein
VVAPASAGRRDDGTSGRRERSASALDQRHVCAGTAAIPVINPQTMRGGNVPSRIVGYPQFETKGTSSCSSTDLRNPSLSSPRPS